jgi:Mrp family chromosome partitioning ATPase/capsular polysaccharide biosynthesis protein
MPKNAIVRHYALVIRDRSILILFFFVICTSSTYIVSLYLPPIYQATTIVKISAAAASDTTQAQELIDNGPVLVTSPEVLQIAAQSLAPSTVQQLQQATRSSVPDHTQLLIIQSQAISAQRATRIADIVAKSYIQVQQEKESAHLQETLQTLTLQIQSTRQSLDTAQQSLDTLQADAGTAQNISQQKSLVDTHQSSYNQLLTTYAQIQTQKVQIPEMLYIIQPATVTEQPTSSHIWLNTALAAGISLTVLCLLAILVDWLDSSIKTADDVASMDGLEPLGQIPFLDSLQDNTQLLDFSQQNLDAIREAAAVMGVNFQMRYKGQHALLCTSLHKQAGTTLTASQLATTLAQSGMRVLLIDAHLKRPTLHTIFNLPNTYGLTNSINDFMAQPVSYTADWLAQWKTYVPNLWLLPAGPTYEHCQSQISTPHLIQLKERLLEQPSLDVHSTSPQLIDIMIFDAPPLEDGSLTQRLTAVADASILTVKSQQEQPEELMKARRILQHLETPILGVVVNRYKARYRSYFYRVPQQYTYTDSEQRMALADITSQRRIAEEIKLPAAEDIPQIKTTQVSSYRELPETPQPWRRSELFAFTAAEPMNDPTTSVKLPNVEKQSIQKRELLKSRRNIYQFKRPYEQEEYNESREQLT